MNSYKISTVELFPKGEGIIPLSVNNKYKSLIKLKNKLEKSRDGMEPYFKRYQSNFRSIISNFGSFKRTKFHISQRFHTPSVTNSWISIYEIISYYNLVPEDIDEKSWNFFNSENLPGSSILSVYHYINTICKEKYRYKYNWFGSSPVNSKLFNGDDLYKLVNNYPDKWFISEQYKNSLKDGDITNINFNKRIKEWLDNRSNGIDFFIGNLSIEIKKDYNLEEIKHNKIFLGQIFLCFNILKKNGNAIFRNLTFFTKFNISMISYISLYFDEIYICKPMSSKNDSSEIYIICKKFKGISSNEINKIEKILSNNKFDYENDQIINLEKIKKQFWTDIRNASKIFENQIINIGSNIENFNKLIRNKNNFDINKIKSESMYLFKNKSERENIEWGNHYPIYVLHDRLWLNVINTTQHNINYR